MVNRAQHAAWPTNIVNDRAQVNTSMSSDANLSHPSGLGMLYIFLYVGLIPNRSFQQKNLLIFNSILISVVMYFRK